MKKIQNLLFPLFIATTISFVSGCTTLNDARTAEGTGLKQIYNKDFDTVWKSTIKTMNTLGLPLAGENKSEGYILAKTSISMTSYGENIAVFIRKRSEKETSVEVVSKRAMTTNIFATDWSKEILSKLSALLN